MPSKLFLYDKKVANKDLLNYFNNRNYTTVALNVYPSFFWTQVDSVNNDGYLAIMSHGDNQTFEIATGNSPADLPHDRIVPFATSLLQRNVTLYLLSCHTGNNPLGELLGIPNFKFAAPKGFAQVKPRPEGAVVLSVEDPNALVLKFPGWTGSEDVIPNRAAKQLNIK
ncbi:hypothetical protein [Burkholderia oklahomensis]|uniref:Uncharacterized protein n=1 Tax=Burkholderia oklahomensis TaxID=342113 RepID=A0AAI8BA02_9BURK|nr:hypothetical protein [Burkholderia oklahomensis]AIO68271.1 hypothetical protein DM82_3344 [Burkholderia oklahomensis]QPS38718.1 hypothetical protein I6G57_07820 [Burkholderia oklahomensis]